MIVVDGALNSRKWTDKDGNNRVSWEIQAQNVYFGDSKRNDEGQQCKPQTFEEVASEDDEALPF
jgi:single-strand DNA-binding protein